MQRSQDLRGDAPERIDDAQFTTAEAVIRQPNRWHLFCPERTFDLLVSGLRPFRDLIVLIPVVFAFSAFGVMVNWQSFSREAVSAMADFGLIGRLILAALTFNLISQIAKGIVARFYGLMVPSFGVILGYGLIPRFNVRIQPSPSLDRRARLWLAATSILVSLLFSGLAGLFWLFTRSSGSLLSSLAIEIACLSTMSLLFIANPLWKGDGYLFLATLLNTPDLDIRSRNALKRLFIRPPDAVSRYTKNAFPLAVYGLASLLFMALFAALIAFAAGNWLKWHYRGTGVVVFLALVIYVAFSVRRQQKAMKVSHEPEVPDGESHSRLQSRLKPRKPHSVTQTPVRSVWKRMIRSALLLLFFAILLLPYRYDAGGDATITPSARMKIAAESDGIVESVYFNGGEWVEKNTVIARLASYRQSKDVQATLSEIKSKQKEIAWLLTTPSKEELDLAKEQLNTARLQLKYSIDETARMETLFKKGTVSLQDVEKAREAVDLDRQRVTENLDSLNALQTKINPYQIESLEADVERSSADLAYYQEQLRRTDLKMPMSGCIITMNLQDLKNTYLEKGHLFAEVENTRLVKVEIAVPEFDIDHVRLDAPVSVRFWARPGQNFHGRVTAIFATATQLDYGPVVTVVTELENVDGLLKSGLTGYAKIEGDTVPVMVAFTRAFVRFMQIELWSWIP